LLSNVALALGLGEIKVKSQPGQPLLAEIPIISSEPGELEQLRARLASPVTFERVGLPRPQGLVNELDFAVALDEAGRPVVRVTSRTPVDVPAVNFLIEVDWGQGRLVREYSALVSAPGTLAAAEQPVIDAPAAAPTDTILRPAEPVVATPAEPPPQATQQAPVPPAPAPAPVVAATPAPQPTPGDALAPVRRGQSLSQIAAPLARAQGYTLDQAMVALLRANPDAFINGNLNLLKQGAVLRVPESAEAQAILESEAAALVRSQIAEWRSARAPIPQPAAVVAPASAPATPVAPPRTAPVADARLEIAPAATSTSGSGTQSGVSAGGEGEMLANEQLQQSKEDLAAREAEVQELRSQVADLEKLKAQQEKLLAMKDSDLAAAQQRLAQSNGSDGGVPVWAWAGFGLLFVGALAWGFAQRRQRVAPAPVPRNPVFDDAPSGSRAAELAAGMPSAPAAAVEPTPTPSPVLEPVVIVPAAAPPKPVVKPAPAPAAGPTWHAGGGAPVVAVTPPQAPAGRDRLELAVAYLDLGDVATARDLLNEVAAGNDAVARDEALQLLRELG
jgi:pilus assembly protein FimV